jgi:hypothetical protein
MLPKVVKLIRSVAVKGQGTFEMAVEQKNFANVNTS